MIERDAHYEMMYGDAMLEEMSKIAGIGSALRHFAKKPANAAKGISAINKGRLAGVAIGSGLGGAAGAAANEDNRVGGFARGALYGGIAGLGAGQLATKAGRTQAKHFGQRQLHGATGYIPRTAQQKAMGIGFAGKGLSKSQRVQALKQMGMDVGSVGNKPKAISDAMSKQTVFKYAPKKVREGLAKSEVAGEAARRHAAEQGLTSIPGVAKGLIRRPIDTLRTGFVSQGPLGMALAAVPTAAMLPGAIRGHGYGEEYSDKGGLGRMAGENLGYTALGATPLAPMMVGSVIAGKAGELLHRGGSKAKEQWQAGRVQR